MGLLSRISAAAVAGHGPALPVAWVTRCVATLLALFGAGLLAGCGGSVADADADTPRPTRTTVAQTPFCTAVRANAEAIRPLNVMSSGGSRPPNLAGTVEQVRRTGSELVRVAPDDIRSDVERTVQAVNLQLDVLVANGGDTAAVARDPELMAKLSSPELAGASERYRDYVGQTCGSSGSGRSSGG